MSIIRGARAACPLAAPSGAAVNVVGVQAGRRREAYEYLHECIKWQGTWSVREGTRR